MLFNEKQIKVKMIVQSQKAATPSNRKTLANIFQEVRFEKSKKEMSKIKINRHIIKNDKMLKGLA